MEQETKKKKKFDRRQEANYMRNLTSSHNPPLSNPRFFPPFPLFVILQAPSPGQLNNVGGWDLAAFLSSNPKVQALQQIRDDSIAEKHSTSNRLLHSVLYTVGRAIAQNCAIKDKKAVEAKVFFNKIFELWWSQFPFLQVRTYPCFIGLVYIFVKRS